MINEITELEQKLIEILDNISIEDMPGKWKNSKFLKQRMIQIDKRGSVGERFFAEILLRLFQEELNIKMVKEEFEKHFKF